MSAAVAISVGERIRRREIREAARAAQMVLALDESSGAAVPRGCELRELASRVRSALHMAPAPLTVAELARLSPCTEHDARVAIRALRTHGLLEVVGSRRERRYRLLMVYPRPKPARAPLPMAMVSRGGGPRRDDCAHYGECLGELVRREEDPPDAQCPRGCAHYQQASKHYDIERFTRVGSDGRSA